MVDTLSVKVMEITASQNSHLVTLRIVRDADRAHRVEKVLLLLVVLLEDDEGAGFRDLFFCGAGRLAEDAKVEISARRSRSC